MKYITGTTFTIESNAIQYSMLLRVGETYTLTQITLGDDATYHFMNVATGEVTEIPFKESKEADKFISRLKA